MNFKLFLGATGVVCAATLFHTLLPRWLTSAVSAPSVSSFTERALHVQNSDQTRLELTGLQRNMTRYEQVKSPALAQSLQTPSKARKLLAGLAQGSAWTQMNLSDWEQVARLGMSFEKSLPKLLSIDGESLPNLVNALEQMHSVGCRQVLLVALGSLGYPDEKRLEPFLNLPGLYAAAAYAIGRVPGPGGHQLLESAYVSTRPLGPERQAILLGLSQKGLPALSRLMAAARAKALLNPESGEDQPLWYAQGPGVAEAVAKSLYNEPLGPFADSLLHALAFGSAQFTDLGQQQVFADWLENSLLRMESMPSILDTALHALIRFAPDRYWRRMNKSSSEYLGGLQVIHAAALQATNWEQARALLEHMAGGDPSSAPAGPGRDLALRTLARLPWDAADLWTARLLAQGSSGDRAGSLAGLQERSRAPSPEEPALAFPPGPETAISLRNILVSAALPPAQSLEAIELLARAPDAAPEMIQNLEGWALRDLDRAVADGMAPLEALVNNAQVLGATGRLLLIEEFSRQDSLIARLEILNSLLNLPIEFQEPFITDFVRREALPWAREHLGVLVDASLAYIGRSDQRPNLAFTSLIGLFGMHGSEEDIPRIEALRISMQNRCASWPKAIRESVLQAGEECCLRTLDLLALSQ